MQLTGRMEEELQHLQENCIVGRNPVFLEPAAP
jgi:hypothetical protein